jgi:2-polyprenyl-3-methyl-5-hydroxy-6-metoxy-1,4-benzoquinol methylase
MLLGARAQAQAAIGGEKATEAFTDLVHHLSRVEREDETSKMKERLEKLKTIKEIRFRPLSTVNKTRNLPVVSADDVRRAGKLAEQMRPVNPRRPERARTKRTRR